MNTFPYHSGKHFHDALVLWWERNVVAPDPDPRYSYLDRFDGLSEATMPSMDYTTERHDGYGDD